MARAAQLATGTSDVEVVTGDGNLRGWSIRESGGVAAVATVILRQGSASGDILAIVELAADKSESQWFGANDGIDFRGGLWADRVAGETEGTVYVD